MRVSVLVPFRGDGGARDRAWDYCRPRWEASGWELSVGTHDGPGGFNISAAFNDAAAHASGDAYLLVGADLIPSLEQPAAALAALDAHPWAPVYAATGSFGPDETDAIYAGVNPDGLPLAELGGICTGILAIRAAAWRDFGGMDERFTGWGYEDDALRCVLNTLYGESPHGADGVAKTLYHPKAMPGPMTNYLLYLRYADASTPDEMRALLAER